MTGPADQSSIHEDAEEEVIVLYVVMDHSIAQIATEGGGRRRMGDVLLAASIDTAHLVTCPTWWLKREGEGANKQPTTTKPNRQTEKRSDGGEGNVVD